MTRLSALAALAAAELATAPGATAQQPEPAGQPPVVIEVSDGGFHWLDAGIGAAAAFAVVLLVAGLVLALRQADDREGA